MRKCILLIVCLLLSAAGAYADESHWTVNPHGFQYDMTAYVKVVSTAGNPLQQDGFEVAAFCGEECRGVGKLLTASDGTQVFQLRIRSNEASGETILLRVYEKASSTEFHTNVNIAFVSQAVEGTPSEPLSLSVGIVLKGDVNGDGDVDIADAVVIVNHVVGKVTPSFFEAAADVNNDGDIDIADAVRIVNFVVGKIDAFSRNYDVGRMNLKQ